jgi:hypothetical protein
VRSNTPLSKRTSLVIGGATEDKPEALAKAAWADVGVDFRTGFLTEEIHAAVDEILTPVHADVP